MTAAPGDLPNPQPWDVWWVDFQPSIGHEQRKVRPAVVVSAGHMCHPRAPIRIVVPLTSRRARRPYPFRIPVELPGLGESWAMCDQPKSFDVARFGNLLCRGSELPPEARVGISTALMGVLAEA